ncbi:MAG: hypothetical protein K6F74_05350 [Prevotella sp.]|nr:hypothetical protein [Prevotella sp.]
MTLIDAIHKRDTELQKILGSMENKKVFNRILFWLKMWWQDTKRQLFVTSPWKDAQGDDLPEYDREVIAILDYDFGHYKVVYAHRPNPNGWNGTNIDTGEKEYFEPVIYDKGWNQPHVLFWLDTILPYEENKIIK